MPNYISYFYISQKGKLCAETLNAHDETLMGMCESAVTWPAEHCFRDCHRATLSMETFACETAPAAAACVCVCVCACVEEAVIERSLLWHLKFSANLCSVAVWLKIVLEDGLSGFVNVCVCSEWGCVVSVPWVPCSTKPAKACSSITRRRRK